MAITTTQQLRSAADRLIELHESGDLDAVLSLADEVSAAALGWVEPDEIVRESLFIARFQRAIALTEREDLTGAARAYAEAAETPSDPDDPDQRHEVAMALLHRGMCLDALDEPELAIEAYGRVVERFGGAEDPVTRDQVVRARVNRSVAWLNAGDPKAARTEAEDLAGELDRSVPLDAEQWIMTRRISAAALQSTGRAEQAVNVLSEVDTVELDDPSVLEQQASAELERAELLEALGDDDAAGRVRAAAASHEQAVIDLGGVTDAVHG